MKSIVLTIATLFSANGFAIDRNSACVIFSENACIINPTQNEALLEVHYPNLSVCGLKILPAVQRGVATELPMMDIAADLKGTVRDSSVGQTIELTLTMNERVSAAILTDVGPNDLFVAPITLKTKSGKPIGQLIAEELGANGNLVVVPVLCDRN
ncbi:MAG: hypothetical protein AB7T49_20160 [Oligoflexales bacterium]